MRYKKICRAVVLAVLVFSLAATTFYHRHMQEISCMGVVVLREEQIKNCTTYVQQDFSNMFFHNGEMAAIDINNFTIYISQQIDEDTKFSDFVGKLSFANPNYKLYFAYDEYFDKLAQAVRESHPFKLLVADGSGIYTEYKVIFTTLPLMRMTGATACRSEENK